MIIISDAHINESFGRHAEFFRMLRALESNDEDLVFLGDIFDLWIALPRYESDIHRRFLSWCGRQSKKRRVGFIEGNHEFYLAEEHRKFFTWCSDKGYYRDVNGHVFCHGDQINRHDRRYIFFRKMVKNSALKSGLHMMPFGPLCVKYIKTTLKHTNREFRKRLPKGELKRFAHSRFDAGDRVVFVGHFHQEHRISGRNGQILCTLPCWFEKGLVTHFDERYERVSHDKWSQLLG